MDGSLEKRAANSNSVELWEEVQTLGRGVKAGHKCPGDGDMVQLVVSLLCESHPWHLHKTKPCVGWLVSHRSTGNVEASRCRTL